jgi:cystathionine beta-lyase/cystathionine gamma-synthase
VSHSWSTSHRQLDGEQKKALGITEGLLRFSIGIEKIEDLIAHFSKGMKDIS